ncbi:MAG: hypothetical protein ACR2N3_02760 [Pyrinomonadaceae bacterium]
MRLVKVSAPPEKSEEIIQLAFSVGIRQASKYQVENYSADAEKQTKDVIELQTSTPKAKRFIDALLKSNFYNRTDFSISTRQPRSIISGENLRELTRPLVDPITDILEELWQFSHITISFIGRFFIAGCLLAFGLIHWQILIIVAGLLFLPILPLLLSIGFGAWTKQWKLSAQGSLAFLTAVILLITAGVAVAAFSQPPIKYDEFNSLPVSFFISLAVGIAAALANSDDVGARELIGLAATAQLAIIPVWFGICFVLGFPAMTTHDEVINRSIAFFINFSTIIIASLAAYIFLGAANSSLKKIKTK